MNLHNRNLYQPPGTINHLSHALQRIWRTIKLADNASIVCRKYTHEKDKILHQDLIDKRHIPQLVGLICTYWETTEGSTV